MRKVSNISDSDSCELYQMQTTEKNHLFNPLLHNVEKIAKRTLKILRCEHRKIFKVCLAIFQHYAIKG